MHVGRVREVCVCVCEEGEGVWFRSSHNALESARLTDGSREIILTVWSARPTARNLERCSPGGTVPRLMHTTSADISLRSVYSFSWPD